MWGILPQVLEAPTPSPVSLDTEVLEQHVNSLYVCRHCNFHHAYRWVVTKHMYEKHPEYYTSAFMSQAKSGAPTTMSVPPVEGNIQHGSGDEYDIF